MNALIVGWRYAAVAALILGLPLAAACSAGEATGSDDSAATDEELSIEFPTMYTAFGDSQDYQLPVHVGGITGVKFTADPSDAVSFDKQDDDTGTTYMITVKKFYDTVTITAKAGSLKQTADLHMTASTDELWKQGSDRYNNGVVIKHGGDHDGGGGGRPDGGWGGDKGERVVDKTLACTNCHAKGGKKGGDVEHTPTQTAGYSDEDLVNIFTKAEKPSWAKMRVTTAEKWKKIHQWSMEEDEKAGLVVYLRSLTPESQGDLDFGGGVFGHGGGGGGGKHNHDDDDSKTSDKSASDDKPATN